MIEQYYKLSYTNWEEYEPHFFIGPDMTQEQFKNICDSMLGIAGARALEVYSDTSIGWREIVECMIPSLEEMGFKYIKPMEASYFGPGIIDSKNDFKSELYEKRFGYIAQSIIDHNLKLMKMDCDDGNKNV